MWFAKFEFVQLWEFEFEFTVTKQILKWFTEKKTKRTGTNMGQRNRVGPAQFHPRAREKKCFPTGGTHLSVL
jgi:hypothetical protein